MQNTQVNVMPNEYWTKFLQNPHEHHFFKLQYNGKEAMLTILIEPPNNFVFSMSFYYGNVNCVLDVLDLPVMKDLPKSYIDHLLHYRDCFCWELSDATDEVILKK
jgi:hypothetical protein